MASVDSNLERESYSRLQLIPGLATRWRKIMDKNSWAASVGLKTGKESNLTRVFATFSLLAIVVIVTASAYVQSRFLTEQVLLRDATVTREFIDSIVRFEGTATHFVVSDESGHSDKLLSFFGHIVTMPDVMGANVYDSAGRIMLSSNPELMGEHFHDNDELKHALAGELAYETGRVGETDKQEHSALGKEHIGARFVETYVPIIDGEKKSLVGVVEVYKVPLALDKSISDGLTRLWLGALLGGGVLFFSLFWIVRRAHRLIDDQHRRLTEVETLAMVGETAAAVIHGIRNPLASIRAAAEVSLAEDIEGARESARDIISEVDRLASWTRDLLLFSNLPAQHAPTSKVDINQLVTVVTDEFANRQKKRGITIHLSLAEGLPLVNATDEPLRHVITSILANAAEAMPCGGSISVRSHLDRKRRMVVLSVQDTGPGLTEEQIEKVMKPFYSTKRGGTGLGLPLSQQIMQRFGGKIALSKRKMGLVVELSFRPFDVRTTGKQSDPPARLPQTSEATS